MYKYSCSSKTPSGYFKNHIWQLIGEVWQPYVYHKVSAFNMCWISHPFGNGDIERVGQTVYSVQIVAVTNTDSGCKKRPRNQKHYDLII